MTEENKDKKEEEPGTNSGSEAATKPGTNSGSEAAPKPGTNSGSR
ncbi:hypothetical protein [Mycoplasma capricolum]|nr:hypothetical protein [Mycoplasma capricolum]